MAAQIVHLLKNSRELSVYQVNSNLRIPGFKQLEGCNTTVDMDTDPEVYVMLEPIQIMGKRVTQTEDCHRSARRLRSVFTAAISFFQWRLPNGERMLRENGIENIPGQIFDEIKTSLVRSDPHFARFPSMAIKRCLLLFTESLLPVPQRAEPEAVKQFQAMLLRTPSPTAESISSMVAEAATSPTQDAEASSWVDSIEGPSSPGPLTVTKDTSASTDLPGYTDVEDMGTGCGNGQPAAKAQGGSKTVESSGGKRAEWSHEDSSTPMVTTAPTVTDKHAAAVGLIELSQTSSPLPTASPPVISQAAINHARKPSNTFVAPANPNNVPVLPQIHTESPARKRKDSYPAPLNIPMEADSNRDPSPFSLGGAVDSSPSPAAVADSHSMSSPKQAPPTTLGKHPRAELELEEEDHYRPRTIQKRQHEPQYNAHTGGSEELDRFDRELAEVKELMAQEARRHREVAASEEILALQVKYLRERVRNFEEEKQAALDMQRRQLRRELRPGLVTMKMTPRAQARVNQLFGSTGNAAGAKAGASPSRAQSGKKGSGDKKASDGEAACTSTAENRSLAPVLQGLQMFAAAAPSQGPGATDTPNTLPPIGVFRRPVSYEYPEPDINEAPTSKASISKTSTSTAISTASTLNELRASSPMDVGGHDSGEETEATECSEGSAVSTDSSYCPTVSP